MLNGANTYSNTVIQGGTVVGNASSIRGNVTFKVVEGPPSVNFNQTTPGTFAGAITGPGSLIKSGAGALTLAGKNNYSGGATVQGGILQGDSNSLQGNITSTSGNSGVVFDQGFDGIYAGKLAGPGTLAKNGAGRLSITGIDQAGGGTTINGGTLAVNGTLTSNVLSTKTAPLPAARMSSAT